ncbi:hypothetical protein GCM10022284_31300 [Streptomyces hundungensis]
MHDDEGAVLAQVQIEFDDIHAHAFGVDEGTQGVLRLDTHDPAMTDGEERQDRPRFRRRRYWRATQSRAHAAAAA